MTTAPAAPSEVLRLEGVALVRDGRALVRDVDLRIAPGDHWALLGPNGAGKSTLLSLCGAVNHPTSGTVHVLGRRLGRVDMRGLRGSIGHVDPRHPLRSPLTVTQVVLTGATGSIEPVPRRRPAPHELRRTAELLDALGLSTIRDAPWTTLSQGERGRTLIARALLPDPPLLLLDEPSTGLDVAARERLLETLDHLHGAQPRLASVLVTHHLEELPASTTHAVLVAGGRILAAGPAAEVLTGEQVSACFSFPIDIEHSGGRWLARAGSRATGLRGDAAPAPPAPPEPRPGPF
ncbi:ABC transporter ATP-binding protein [Streptomyces sp. NPDC051018]|uniref:ABC transporter ATP-binding protein n=1 Tax=Streptomyces sp. NPDC051018 TaxID=3365639 RepID=UPI0037BD1556